MTRINNVCVRSDRKFFKSTNVADMVTSLLLDSVDALWIVPVPLLLSQCLPAPLVFGERPPHGAGLLGPEVQGLELLLAVQLSEVVPLVVVDHSQHSCYRLAHHLTVCVE